MKAVVVGGAGYVGGELLRMLLNHPEVDELVATSRSQAGVPIADIHPSLAMLTDSRLSGDTPVDAARGADVVFMALEHGASSLVMADVIDSGPGMVVDLAADFRITDGRLHEQYYGRHPSPELVHRFRYGLADVIGEGLRGATAIAAPGCFATAAQLALYSVADLDLAAPPVVFAVTGSSGAGQAVRPTTHHPMRSGNMFAYNPMSHRHEGEVLEQWRAWRDDSAAHARLMTHAGPFVRGIHVTLHAHLSSAIEDPLVGIRTRFAGRDFVRVMENAPQLSHVVGSNMAMVSATRSPDGREVQVMCVIDNLIKGAGGQAIQGMNLALGIPETAGLLSAGQAPC